MKKLAALLLLLLACLTIEAKGKHDKIKKKSVDKQMTDETARLHTDLFELKKKGMMVGQHDGIWMEEGQGVVGHLPNLSGRLPAIASFDFMFITNRQNKPGTWHREQEHNIRQRILAAHREGVYITMCWHYNEPYKGHTFYTQSMDSVHKLTAFKSILKDGENHEQFKKDLRTVAEFSNTLVDDNGKLIPFIFRPFHEFDGEWFWWGADYNTPEEFKSVWKFTVNYLRDSLQMHNMLYAFSPDVRFETEEDFLLRYPGDDYVDIIGFDDYNDFKFDKEKAEGAKKRIRIVGELAKKKNKLAALTETAYFMRNAGADPVDIERFDRHLDIIAEMHKYLSFFAYWGNGGGGYCVPQKDQVGAQKLLDFLDQPFIIMNDNKKKLLNEK